MVLLEKTFDRTLDAWIHAYKAPAWRGAAVEGWSVSYTHLTLPTTPYV